MANLANIDQLIEAGLAPIKKLTYARIVLNNPHEGIYSMVYRDLAANIFTKITDYILNDSILFNRLRQLLMQEHGLSSSAFEALLKKATKSNLPLNIVLEIYQRGFKDQAYPNLTPEQKAFNRVNSFIAGGLARKLDADLWEAAVELDPDKREWGTTSLTDLYKKGTPGQTSNTLKTIRKNIKK